MSDNQMRLCTKSVEHTSELDGDVSSTNDDDLLWLFLNIKEPIRVDTVRSSWDLIIGRNGRSTTDSYCDLLGLDLVFRSVVLRDFEGVRVDEFGPSFMVVYFLLAEVGLTTWSATTRCDRRV